MLLLANDLFRLDTVLSGDTLRIMIRNLSSGDLETRSRFDGYPGEHIIFGDAECYRPSHSSVEFTLGSGADRVTVTVDLATLRFPDRGTAQVTAQAIVRESPEVPS